MNKKYGFGGGGRYVRTGADTHWTQIIACKTPEEDTKYGKGYFLIEDSYPETNEAVIQQNMKEFNLSREDVLFLKKLDWNFGIFWAKKIWIGKRASEQELSIFSKILALFAKILMLDLEILKQKEAPKIPEPISVPVAPEIHVSRIKDWASAIAIMENAPKHWGNPGAIKGLDGKFLTFKTTEGGFEYLCNYLVRCCTGLHKAYPKGGETTLLEFQRIYSPAHDNNSPERYADFVCGKLGITRDTKIGSLL